MDMPQLFDVVVASFPFSDIMTLKRRPAVVVSSYAFNESTQH